MGSPDWCDPKVAGWWVWGACAWIGSGWCAGSGPWHSVDGVLTLGDAGQGINRQIPHLGNSGRGVHADRVAGQTTGKGWADDIHARMRRVRVACGDWQRVVTTTVTTAQGITGVFLDPPYEVGQGYDEQRSGISDEVWDWACEAGRDQRMRIAVCGYEDGRTVPHGWRSVAWKAHGGYGAGRSNEADGNSSRERIWLSPSCIDKEQMGLL